MAEEKKYILDGYRFNDSDSYEQARRELNKIAEIKSEQDLKDETELRAVYDRLVESGDILAFKGKDNESAFYQYSGEHKECNEHLHLQCNSCGKIFHLEHGFVDDFMERLRKECKVELDVSKTMLVGTCEKCLAKD